MQNQLKLNYFVMKKLF